MKHVATPDMRGQVRRRRAAVTSEGMSGVDAEYAVHGARGLGRLVHRRRGLQAASPAALLVPFEVPVACRAGTIAGRWLWLPSGKVEEALDEWHDLVRRAVAIILTICTCDVELILFNVIGEAQDAAVPNRVGESALNKRCIGVAQLLPEAADEDLRVRDRQCDEGESSMHRHAQLS